MAHNNLGLNAPKFNIHNWRNIREISSDIEHAVGLRRDGTVVACGKNSKKKCEVTEWNNIVAIAAGSDFTAGVKADGSVITTWDKRRTPFDVSNWQDIVAISAYGLHLAGLKKDGTVVATSLDKRTFYDNLYKLNDIVAISVGNNHIIGLKKDSTVVAVPIRCPQYTTECCKVSNWKNVVSIYAENGISVGIKRNGRILTAGNNPFSMAGLLTGNNAFSW